MLLYKKFAAALETTARVSGAKQRISSRKFLPHFRRRPIAVLPAPLRSYVLNPPDEPWQPTVRIDQK